MNLENIIERPFSIARTQNGVVLSYFTDDSARPVFERYSSVEQIALNILLFKNEEKKETRLLAFSPETYALKMYSDIDDWAKVGCYLFVHFAKSNYQKQLDKQQMAEYLEHPLRYHLDSGDINPPFGRVKGWAVWSQRYFDFYFGLGEIPVMTPEMFVPLFVNKTKRRIYYPQLLDDKYVWKSVPFADYKVLSPERGEDGWVRNILQITREDGRLVVLSYQAHGVPCGDIDLYHVDMHEENI